MIRPEQAEDQVAIEALLNHAFGPGRFSKVSERVREFATPRRDLSFCAWANDQVVGIVRLWQVRIGGQDCLFLGPLAVHRDLRESGTGSQLVEQACLAAEGAGWPLILLVGDEPYFRRFGFSARETAGVQMPGPVNMSRLLARGASGPLSGPVTA